MIFIFIFLFFVLFSARFCSFTEEREDLSDKAQDKYMARVVNGELVPISHYPYTAFVDLGNGGTCGGAILSKTWILTAGHCKGPEMAVYVNADQIFRGKYCKVINAVRHPLYKLRQWGEIIRIRYDYMLLELKFSLYLTEGIQPIAIGSYKSLVDGDLATLTGYGDDSMQCLVPFVNCIPKVKKHSLLHMAELPIILRNRCILIKPSYADNLGLNEFCAGDLVGEKSACTGDSGSPLVYNGNLVGIVSRGATFLLCHQSPGIFSSVPFVSHWIRNVTDI